MPRMWFKSFVFVVFLVFCDCTEVPSFLHVCRRNDPNLGSCLTSSLQGLRPFLAAGVSDYNIPSIEPLPLTNFSFTTIRINFTSEDAKLYGLSKFYVNKFRPDITDQNFELDIEVPRLKIISNYSVSGKFLVLNLNETDSMETNLVDCSIKSHFKSDLVTLDDDEKHLELTECTSRIKCRKGSVDLGDFFGGRESLLNVVLHEAVNEDFHNFFEHLQPSLEASVSDAILGIGNRILSAFTYKQLFP